MSTTGHSGLCVVRSRAVDGSRKRILIADAQALFRQALGVFFRETYANVEVVETACLDSVDGGMIAAGLELTVVDADLLAVCDGMVASQDRTWATLAARFLVLLSKPDPEAVKAVLKLGASGVVLKDSPLHVFREAVDALLRGQKYFCPLTSDLLVATLRQGWDQAPGGLTPRELVIVRHYAAGMNAKQIAAMLGIGPKTVQNRLHAIRGKLGIAAPAGLVRYALDNKIV